MAELADAQDLGSCVFWRAGSTPVTRSKVESRLLSHFYGLAGDFLFYINALF